MKKSSAKEDSNFNKQIDVDCQEMGTLLKDLQLQSEIEEEEATSSLYSPIHFGETDTKNMETECTGDSK